MAKRRIRKEYKDVIKRGNTFNIQLIDNNIFQWKAMLKGPLKTPYANGEYFLNIIIPNGYPFQPPKINFINPPYCLNVIGHNDLKDNKKLGEISMDILGDKWSPAFFINTTLKKIYDFCFYECGYDASYKWYKSKPDCPYLNKYQLYLSRPREFLFNISKCNEIYGKGDKAVYYLLPQMNEMQYFQNVSIIDNILRDKYKCNEDIIEQFLQFYGEKVNFCGLNQDKFTIPQFNGIEDSGIINDDYKTNIPVIRLCDDIQTDIANATNDGKSFEITVKGISKTNILRVCDNLTVMDLKVISAAKYWSYSCSVDQTRFIYKAKEMTDNRILKHYNIGEHSVVYWVSRLYGG